MCTWRRLRSKPQSFLLLYGLFGEVQFGSVEPLAHDVQFLSPGFELHCEVPLGGSNAVLMNRYPCPPSERTSISESFSSVRTMIATSESGRRKSRRSWRIV